MDAEGNFKEPQLETYFGETQINTSSLDSSSSSIATPKMLQQTYSHFVTYWVETWKVCYVCQRSSEKIPRVQEIRLIRFSRGAIKWVLHAPTLPHCPDLHPTSTIWSSASIVNSSDYILNTLSSTCLPKANHRPIPHCQRIH